MPAALSVLVHGAVIAALGVALGTRGAGNGIRPGHEPGALVMTLLDAEEAPRPAPLRENGSEEPRTTAPSAEEHESLPADAAEALAQAAQVRVSQLDLRAIAADIAESLDGQASLWKRMGRGAISAAASLGDASWATAKGWGLSGVDGPDETPARTGGAGGVDEGRGEYLAPIPCRDNSQPDYPAAWRRAGREGTVVVRIRVGIDGRALAATVDTSSGDRELDGSAQQAASTWRFAPARLDGTPVEAEVVMPVRFVVRR